jgi:hypothetical protein
MKRINPSTLEFNQVNCSYLGHQIRCFLGGRVIASTKGFTFAWGNNFFHRLFIDYDKETVTEIMPLNRLEMGMEPGEWIVGASKGEFHHGFVSNLGNIYSAGGNKSFELGGARERVGVKLTSLSLNLENDEKIVQLKYFLNSSSALTNRGKVFIWGNALWHLKSILPKNDLAHENRSPYRLDLLLGLKKGETISHFTFGFEDTWNNGIEEVHKHGYQALFVTNQNEVKGIKDSQIINFKPILKDLIKSRIKNVFSDEKTILLLTEEGELFNFGIDIFSGKKTKVFTELTSRFNLEDGDRIKAISFTRGSLAALTLKGKLIIASHHPWLLLYPKNKVATLVVRDLTPLLNLKEGEVIEHFDLGEVSLGYVTSHARVFVIGDHGLSPVSKEEEMSDSPYEITLPEFDFLP